MKRHSGILVNGTSSAGKTTIAKRLGERLPTPSVYMSIDTFLEMMPFRFLDCPEVDGITADCDKLILGFQSCISAMIHEGNFVIVDHVLQEPYWLKHLQSTRMFKGLYKIGVLCHIETAERRERERGDRPIGLARLQYHKVHKGIEYDMEIDTSGDPLLSELDGLIDSIIRRLNV